MYETSDICVFLFAFFVFVRGGLGFVFVFPQESGKFSFPFVHPPRPHPPRWAHCETALPLFVAIIIISVALVRSFPPFIDARKSTHFIPLDRNGIGHLGLTSIFHVKYMFIQQMSYPGGQRVKVVAGYNTSQNILGLGG